MATSDPVLSQTFRLLTDASPERVWGALTCPDAAPRYLYGLSPRTCWSAGAAVEWRAAGARAPVIPGQVLHADPPYRLSVTVEDSSNACTYLTWHVRAGEDGTVVRLVVDECDPGAEAETDLEDVWLPVIARLAELLEEPV